MRYYENSIAMVMLTRIRQRSFRVLHRLSSMEDWLWRRFTGAGQMVLAATFAGALFGIDTRKTLGVQLFGLGMGLLFLALIGSFRRPKGLTAIRNLPRYATVGIPLRYRIQIKNVTAHSVQNLVLQERPPDPRPNLQTFLHTPAPWEHKVNPLDRLIGYPRWRWLIRHNRRIERTQPVNLPLLAAGAETTLELELLPCRRGPLLLNNLEVMYTDPLGLCWSRNVLPPDKGGLRVVNHSSQDRLLVLPRRYPIPSQRSPGRRRLQPGGVALAAAVGDSQEFMGLRDYRPGDSTRHIYWAAWARSGIPVVKEYHDEYFSRQALILDNFVPLGRDADFETAVSVAASFVEPLSGSDALLDLMFVADRAYTLTGGRGVLSTNALLEALACLESQTGEFSTLSQAVLSHASLLSACLCIFLDWDVPRRELIQKLRVLGLPVKILVIGGTSELEPGPMADSPHNLRHLDGQRLAEHLANV